MKLTMLGTGNALAVERYNTCFILEDKQEYLLVDGGGGNGIFKQLAEANIDWLKIKNIFITHKHTDHLLGIVWMIRMIAQHMTQDQYKGNVYIYGHDEVLSDLYQICHLLIRAKEVALIKKRIIFQEVKDGEELTIINQQFTFFDIHSPKDKQFGFQLKHQRYTLTCLGDEPYNPTLEKHVRNSDWLLLEAFCLDSQKDIFKPYEKQHVTVKDACILAEEMNVTNLLLYHTEDKTADQRKKLYLEEGKKYFSQNLYIPEDLESFSL